MHKYSSMKNTASFMLRASFKEPVISAHQRPLYVEGVILFRQEKHNILIGIKTRFPSIRNHTIPSAT